MNSLKPLVIFVFTKQGKPRSTRYDGFAARLKKHGGLKNVNTLTCALENLLYKIDENGTAQVTDLVSGTRFNEASLVYLKSWESMPEEACALTLYLEARGIPYVDNLPLGVGVSKLATMFRMWSSGIQVPETFFVQNSQMLLKHLEQADKSSWPLIMKDGFGEKGKVNFLVQSFAEAQKIVNQYPDTAFICQRFIPNQGDYRVGVYMNKASFVIMRKGDGSSHLNNTSAGGTASYINVKDLPEGFAKFAQDAAVASGLSICGVDIIVDAITKKPMILEVNQGSQIVTGAFVEENIQAFNTMLDSAVRLRHTRPKTKPIALVGRRTHVALPELGITSVVGKIDTGAYSSAIHAENILVETDEHDVEVLSFDICPGERLQLNDNAVQRVSTSDFSVRNIRSSNGRREDRYSIKTKLVIEGRTFTSSLTLTDRSSMRYPILIGRKILRSRFLVNVELSEFNRSEWGHTL